MNEELIRLLNESIIKLNNLNLRYECDQKNVGRVIGNLDTLKILLNHFDTEITLTKVEK